MNLIIFAPKEVCFKPRWGGQITRKKRVLRRLIRVSPTKGGGAHSIPRGRRVSARNATENHKQQQRKLAPIELWYRHWRKCRIGFRRSAGLWRRACEPIEDLIIVNPPCLILWTTLQNARIIRTAELALSTTIRRSFGTAIWEEVLNVSLLFIRWEEREEQGVLKVPFEFLIN